MSSDSSTADIILRLIEIKQELTELANESNFLVERFDLTDVASSVDSAIENLEEIQKYRENPDTDYDSLWSSRLTFLKSVKRSQVNWIRTEIFSMLLEPQSS